MLKARYNFVDASGSRSYTSVTLASSYSDDAVLSLATALQAASEATLTSVDVLLRVRVRDTVTSTLPDAYRIAINYREAIPDAYHALIPCRDETLLLPVLEELTGSVWATRYGLVLEGATQVYFQRVNPNWKVFSPPIPEKRYVVVLPERLWRHLMIVSMSLNSDSLRNETQNATIPIEGFARRELTELLRGTDMDEIITRLDQIIELLQQQQTSDQDTRSLIDDVELLLIEIAALL